MTRTALGLIAGMLLAATGVAATPDDTMKPIRQFIDGFNSGETRSAYAAYAGVDIAIVDEFAPHLWTGHTAPQKWAADYMKHAAANAVTDGSVKYGEPTRTEADGKRAYVVLPTVYTYKDHGKPMVEDGQMTFVLRSASSGWKIRAWTWTGTVPHAAK